MPKPTRAQVEAYLATLPADQQGPALEEVKKRMAAAGPDVAPADASFWSQAQSGDPHTAAPSQLTGEDVKRGALTSAGLGAAYGVPAAVAAAVPAASAYPVALGALGGGTAAAVEGGGLKSILAGALTGGAFTKIGKAWKLAKALGIVPKSAAEISASAEPTLQELIKIKNEAQAAGGDVKNELMKWLERKMAPPEAMSGTQGEMQAMVRKLSSPPEGFVADPPPDVVKAAMTPPVPAGVNSQDVADVQKALGGTWEDAIKTVQSSAIKPKSIVLSSTPAPAAPPAPAPASLAATLAPKIEQPVITTGGDVGSALRSRAFARPNGPTDAEWALMGGDKAKRAWLDATGRIPGPSTGGKAALTPIMSRPGASELEQLLASLLDKGTQQ